MFLDVYIRGHKTTWDCEKFYPVDCFIQFVQILFNDIISDWKLHIVFSALSGNDVKHAI